MVHSRDEAKNVQDACGSSCVTSEQRDVNNTDEALLNGHRRMRRNMFKDATTRLLKIIIITSTFIEHIKIHT